MKPYYDDGWASLYVGDALETLHCLPDGAAQMCVTSPPYWGLRDYGVEGQLGLEPTPEQYVERMVAVFREVRRVLRDDGTIWLNIGDTYSSGGRETQVRDTFRDAASGKQEYLNGTAVRAKTPENCKPKDLVGIPWMLAFALRADGWYLRSDIIWAKPNPMPESVTDRPTKAHEYLFLLSKRERYWYDADAIREAHLPESLKRYEYGLNVSAPADGYVNAGAANPRAIGHAEKLADNINPLGRNKRTVWTIATEPYPEAHFATFPTALVTPCVLAGCPEGGTVLEPFAGSGTTLQVAKELGRKSIGIELNADYAKLATQRLMRVPQPMNFGVA